MLLLSLQIKSFDQKFEEISGFKKCECHWHFHEMNENDLTEMDKLFSSTKMTLQYNM